MIVGITEAVTYLIKILLSVSSTFAPTFFLSMISTYLIVGQSLTII